MTLRTKLDLSLSFLNKIIKKVYYYDFPEPFGKQIEPIVCEPKKLRHNIEVVVDRLIIKDGIQTRLSDSMRTALDLSDGIAYVEILSETKKNNLLSSYVISKLNKVYAFHKKHSRSKRGNFCRHQF